MARTRPPYPPQFRLEAVRLARTSGQLINRTAQDLGVCHETLRHWVRQAEVDAGGVRRGAQHTGRAGAGMIYLTTMTDNRRPCHKKLY